MPVPRRIEVPFRVRFDEAGPDGSLRASAHLRMAQDAAWVHSTEAGFDLAWYRARGRFWLVRCITLQVLRPARHGDVLSVSTAVPAMRRIWARRDSEFRLPGGELAARMSIDWVMTSAEGTPVRVPDELIRAFDAPDEQVRPARVDPGPPPPDANRMSFDVRPQELDPMNHVNNAVYVDYLEEAVLSAGGGDVLRRMPRRYQVEYLAPAEAGARLESIAWPERSVEADGWSFRLRDATRDLFVGRVEA